MLHYSPIKPSSACSFHARQCLIVVTERTEDRTGKLWTGRYIHVYWWYIYTRSLVLKLKWDYRNAKINTKPIVAPGPNLELRTGIEKLLIIKTREFR